MNNVSLVGNLTRDPDYGTTQGGISYCRFTVACQRKYKNDQGGYDADFISCLAWRQTADFVQKHFIKGNRIGLTGHIETGSYTAQDGTKRYTTEVVAENVEFVAPKGENRQDGANAPAPQAAQPQRQRSEQQRMDYSAGLEEVEDDDMLPF